MAPPDAGKDADEPDAHALPAHTDTVTSTLGKTSAVVRLSVQHQHDSRLDFQTLTQGK